MYDFTKKPKKALRFQRGDEFGAGAKQRVAPLTLRQPDNRIPGPRRNMIVGDVSKKSYFASTAGAVSEQTIAKYIKNVVYIGRWFPSSQLCSFCGHRHEELSLTDRFWECSACGACHDRDQNAAKNIRDEGIRILLAVGHTERLNACGASVRPATAGRSR